MCNKKNSWTKVGQNLLLNTIKNNSLLYIEQFFSAKQLYRNRYEIFRFRCHSTREMAGIKCFFFVFVFFSWKFKPWGKKRKKPQPSTMNNKRDTNFSKKLFFRVLQKSKTLPKRQRQNWKTATVAKVLIAFFMI